MEEETMRQIILPFRLWSKYSPSTEVIRRWKERGDWRDKTPRFGWKWRHESPSPEPEDLAQYNTVDNLDLTPSEIDAIDAIPATSPPGVMPFTSGPLFGRCSLGSPSPIPSSAGESVADPTEVGSADLSSLPSSSPPPPH